MRLLSFLLSVTLINLSVLGCLMRLDQVSKPSYFHYLVILIIFLTSLFFYRKKKFKSIKLLAFLNGLMFLYLAIPTIFFLLRLQFPIFKTHTFWRSVIAEMLVIFKTMFDIYSFEMKIGLIATLFVLGMSHLVLGFRNK